ncbi:hypothetical protein N9499_06125 [Octadecabacter sp.]|nr:hypothetical protein [Octadecabacter sp.]
MTTDRIEMGALVRIAPDLHSVESQFHALRLRDAPHDEICEAAWVALGGLGGAS